MTTSIFGNAQNVATKTASHQQYTCPKKPSKLAKGQIGRGLIINGWDYSELSRLAKLNGGPTELLAKHAAHTL